MQLDTPATAGFRYSGGKRHAALFEMQLIFGAVFVLIAVVIVPRLRVPGGVSGGALGSMSEQWLAEYRGSHSA